MATVYDFARRLADSQDWTPGERAQLREMGLQLGVARFDLDIVFGRSDDGDPWCVVTDSSGEVLLHVARIAGCFIVHAATEDQIVEGRDLWSAAFQALGHALKDRRGVLLPFSADALTQNAILAFMLTAAVRGELGRLPGLSEFLGVMGDDREHVQPAPPVDPSSAGHAAVGSSSSPPEADTASVDPRAANVHTPVHIDVQSLPSTTRSETAAAAEAIALAEAQAHGGGLGGERSAKPVELVIAGNGDDTIQLAQHVAAIGGQGADTFVLPLPTAGSRGSVFMGTVLDFHPEEGDRLAFTGGGRMSVVSDQPVADVRAGQKGGPPLPSDVAWAGRKIGYDTNGDHVEDGYVLVSNAAHGWVEQTFGHTGSGPAAHANAGAATATGPVSNAPAPPSMASPPPYHMGD